MFAPGDVTKEVNITIIDDDEIEGDESFEVNLQFVGSSDPNSALGERTRLTVIIEDDDEPSTPGRYSHIS